jgi:hypothetical protein
VIANIVLNTDTRTMIGIALRAMASGLSMSLSSRNRISRKLMATPRMVPTTRPMMALRPETKAASRIRPKLSTNSDHTSDGFGRKYGFHPNTTTASSQIARNATPNSTGGQVARQIRRRRADLTGPRSQQRHRRRARGHAAPRAPR